MVRAPDDLRLAERCAAGDRAAQGRLFDEQRERVHIILYRILGSNRDIDDLVQDAFLQVFRSLPRFRGEATLGTWIDRITTRVAFAYLRRKKRNQPGLESVPLEDTGPSFERRIEARAAARRLYALLDLLSAKQRIAFTLHVIDGRSHRDIARITESTVVATKSRIWRARRQIDRQSRQDPLLAAFLTAGRDKGER